MFAPHKAVALQKAAPVVIGMIGLACCLAAVANMRSQQADDSASARHPIETIAGRAAPHHMRGWQLHSNGGMPRSLG